MARWYIWLAGFVLSVVTLLASPVAGSQDALNSLRKGPSKNKVLPKARNISAPPSAHSGLS